MNRKEIIDFIEQLTGACIFDVDLKYDLSIITIILDDNDEDFEQNYENFKNDNTTPSRQDVIAAISSMVKCDTILSDIVIKNLNEIKQKLMDNTLQN